MAQKHLFSIIYWAQEMQLAVGMCPKKVHATLSLPVFQKKIEQKIEQLSIRHHLVNLILDGALPSPLFSICCADRTCYVCYTAFEVVVEKDIGRKVRADDNTPLSAYMGGNRIECNKNTQSEVKDEEISKNIVRTDCAQNSDESMMDFVLSWRISVPPPAQRPLQNEQLLEFEFLDADHNHKCAHCRDSYDSLYQEFSLFVYPQKRSELGVPTFHEKGVSLSDKTSMTRIFHLYLYNANECTLSDIALLEMVDPSLTPNRDHKTLSSNGFIHEIYANGAKYWARGTLFQNTALQSRCTITAAVTVRMIASNQKGVNGQIVRCKQTIAKWLKIMGLEKNGFRMLRKFQ